MPFPCRLKRRCSAVQAIQEFHPCSLTQTLQLVSHAYMRLATSRSSIQVQKMLIYNILPRRSELNWRHSYIC